MHRDDMKLAARWTNDCQGKMDYDGSIVRVSTRYWPRGGGFHVLVGGDWQGNDTRPEILPSATSEIVLCHGEPREGSPDGDYVTVTDMAFTGETQEDVQAQVEAWAQEQYRRVVAAVLSEFAKDA